MTDENAAVPQAPHAVSPGAAEDPGIAKVIYILYLVGIVVPFTAIVGVIMAYVKKGDAPGWIANHYRFQIRTFWIGCLYTLVGWFTSVFIIGWFILLFVLVWLIMRSVKGMSWLDRREPVENVETWMFP